MRHWRRYGSGAQPEYGPTAPPGSYVVDGRTLVPLEYGPEAPPGSYTVGGLTIVPSWPRWLLPVLGALVVGGVVYWATTRRR